MPRDVTGDKSKLVHVIAWLGAVNQILFSKQLSHMLGNIINSNVTQSQNTITYIYNFILDV